MNNDYIYWAFSSAAQSIAAFIAFLLAGYAIVHNMMESARLKDDTLDEIHSRLLKIYHYRLKILAWLTGFSILLSLITVFSNQWDFPYKDWLIIITSVLDFAAIIFGISFVISIVDPSKYEKTAERIFKEEQPKVDKGGVSDPSAAFFKEFVSLETLLRQYIWDKVIPLEEKMGHLGWGTQPQRLSFRQMVDLLEKLNKLPPDLYKELKEIGEFRNLVFHGNISNVSHLMVQRAIDAKQQVEMLK